MRQSCFIRKLQNRRKSLGSARIVLYREGGAGKGTIPTEHSRKEETIPAKHAGRADYLTDSLGTTVWLVALIGLRLNVSQQPLQRSAQRLG